MPAFPPVLPRRLIRHGRTGRALSRRSMLGGWLAALMLMAVSAKAEESTDVSPIPFTANYTLVLDGWPDVPITQRITQSGDLYIASMEASIKVASGYEQGRFTLQDGTLIPAGYRSGYRLAGLGKDYSREAPDERLDQAPTEQVSSAASPSDQSPSEQSPSEQTRNDDLLPDRQSLLVMLSRTTDTQWTQNACQAAAPCSLDYRDHKGRTRTLVYEIQAQETLQAAGQTFRTLRIDAWRKHRDQKHYRIWLAPRWPGLMVALDYLDHEDVAPGEDPVRKAHLTLDKLSSSRQ